VRGLTSCIPSYARMPAADLTRSAATGDEEGEGHRAMHAPGQPQTVAPELGVCRPTLYSWKIKLLGPGKPATIKSAAPLQRPGLPRGRGVHRGAG